MKSTGSEYWSAPTTIGEWSLVLFRYTTPRDKDVISQNEATAFCNDQLREGHDSNRSLLSPIPH